MRNTFAAFFLVATLVAAPLAGAIRQPVRVAEGRLSGVPGRDAAITVFKGVPYAAPPVGNLRWREPEQPRPWSGVRKADTFGASCAQDAPRAFGSFTPEFWISPDETRSEDCLSLNIWTSAKSAGEKRPVYVYIHGGGFGSGSGRMGIYDGEELARKGLVVVTINYRLGVFGFFAHPELTKESPHRASGNYGLLDQVAALRWLQKNVAAFGGDPARVTIGGQSAGAMSVNDLIASPLGKGLFHRAIAESGGNSLGSSGIFSHMRSLEDAVADGVKFAQSKGAGSLAELRAMSREKLQEPVPGGGGRTAGGFTPPRFLPIVDGYFLPAPEPEILASGKQNDVVILAGYNTGEVSGSGSGGTGAPTAESYAEQARQQYGAASAEFLKLYPESARAQSERDRSLSAIYLWARLRSKTSETKAFLYLFDHSLPGREPQQAGAFHTAEVPYVMNTLRASDRPFTDADRKVAALTSSYWANFVATGDPNGKGLPFWPAAGEKGEIMEIGDRNEPVPVAGNAEKLAFFERHFAAAQ